MLWILKPGSMLGNRRLLKNFAYLSTTQLSNFILPLITLPYLVRILGPDKYGLLAFAQSLNQYFLILQDYGFNLTATRDISRNRNDSLEVSRIFSAVITIKLSMLFISFFVLLGIVSLFDQFSGNKFVFVAYFFPIIGQGLFPIWFFQGTESMKHITILDMTTKIITTTLIFVLVHNDQDYIYVPLIYGMGHLVAASGAHRIIRKKFGVVYKPASIRNILFELKNGFNVFLAELAGGLYHNTVVFLLGTLSTNTIVGFYSATIKILNAMISLLYVISRTFFPAISKEIKNFKKFARIIITTGLLLSFFAFFFNSIIVDILLGKEFAIAKQLLSILSFSLLFASLYICFGTNWLLVNKKDKLFRNIIYMNSILGITITYLLLSHFGLIGAAYGLLITRGLFALSSTYLYVTDIRGNT